MILWLTILASGLFVLLAVKIGFYEIIILFFNTLISVYLAIFLTPVVTGLIPVTIYREYNIILAMIVIAASAFLILYGITSVFLTGRFKVPMPKIFDLLFAGFWGFLTGFLIFSFVAFLICLAPISQSDFIKRIGFDREAQRYNISYICGLCNPINWAVASKENKITSQKAIERLLICANPGARSERDSQPPISK